MQTVFSFQVVKCFNILFHFSLTFHVTGKRDHFTLTLISDKNGYAY